MYSKEFEAEADYVGLYLMARAGFAIEDTPNFWRRMAIAHPGSVKRGLAASHPPTPERFLALEKTVEEIDAKRARSEALLPEAGFQQPRKPRPESRSPFGR
jgi:predicted Zn-dependent protease